MDKNAKLMTAFAMTAITAMLFTAGNVFANPQTDDPWSEPCLGSGWTRW